MKSYLIVLIIGLLIGCSVPVTEVSPTLGPSATLTASVEPSPAKTLTELPTKTEVTSVEPTEEDTFVTPTQELWTTGTPSIMEATPIAGSGGLQDHWQGLPSGTFFTPYGTSNVRSCARITCAIIDRIQVRTEVFSRLELPYANEEWLCRVDLELTDKGSVCPEAIALVYEGNILGNFVLP